MIGPSPSRLPLLVLSLAMLAPTAAPAQDDGRAAPATATAAATVDDDGVLQYVLASGPIGYCILLLSVVAVALFLEQVLSVRRAVLAPAGLAQVLHTHITDGRFREAEQACAAQPSYLGYVVLAGLKEVRIGYDGVVKAMEDASQVQASRLFRKADYLFLISNIAPMLGLLGTVYGILLAFKKIADTEGAAVAAQLAGGVYLALITTVMGLVVAIPTVVAYTVMRGKVETLCTETNLLAEQVFVNYKRKGSK